MDNHPNSSNNHTLPKIPYFRKSRTQEYDQVLQYATQTSVKSALAPTESGIPELSYKLEVVQQPIRARMCGFGEKDRRPISPLPFVRLKIFDEKGPFDIYSIDPGFFVLHANLIENNTGVDASLVLHPLSVPEKKICTENLVGERSTQGKRLKDTDGKEDIWFVFRDMSVRTDGTFRIQFTLTHVGWQGRINTSMLPMKVLGTVCSEVFTVYSAKKFPGMIAATSLSRRFVEQGNKIPTRRNLKRKNQKNSKNSKPSSSSKSSSDGEIEEIDEIDEEEEEVEVDEMEIINKNPLSRKRSHTIDDNINMKKFCIYSPEKMI